MSCYKITAIISHDCLRAVEKALMRLHVRGISVSEVSGYGEYHDFYRRDTMCQHVKIEIFCPDAEREQIIHCIMDAAHTGQQGDGIIAVLPVEQVWRIRTRSLVNTDSGEHD